MRKKAKDFAVIYYIRCLANDKLYVGSTKGVNGRFRKYRTELKSRKTGQTKLQAAYDKYGPEGFATAVLEYVEDETLLPVRELCWILALGDTVKGKTYKNVTVEKSDAEYVHIMFDGGIGRVALADLPADLQKKFNYDPKAAAAATQQEQAQLAASDAQVAAHSSNAAVVADATPLKLLGTVAGA